MMQAVDAERRFRALFEDTYPAVRRYAHYRGLAAADADDLVADVFTVAWRKIDDVPHDDPVPWLLAVARNHWRNLLRKQQRDRELPYRLGPPETMGAPEPSQTTTLRSALRELSDADREILTLIAWDEMSPQQAAVVLGCSATAARVRLHRARKRFAETLRRLETEPQQTPQEA